MTANRMRTWAIVAAAAVGVSVAVYFGFVARNRPAVPAGTAEPTCRIRFLTREERLNPDPTTSHHILRWDWDEPLPADLVDNPLIYGDRFAVVRFENTTGRPLSVFALEPPSGETEEEARARVEERRAMLRRSRFDSERAREHALKLLDAPTPSDYHPASSCFILDNELVGEDGKVITEFVPYQSLDFDSWKRGLPRPAEELRSGNYRTATLQPGEAFELRILPHLGRVTWPSLRQKPGTYTVRAVLTYAEAPGGETRRVAAEAAVTVTAEHIRAAEAFRANRK